MKKKKTIVVLLMTVAVISCFSVAISAAERQRDRFKHSGVIDVEEETPTSSTGGQPAVEAESGFDDLTNGYLEQGPAFETLTEENVIALRSYNDNRFIFEAVETVADGLGPVYNAQSCRECHQNVVTGSASQVTEQRTGRQVNREYFDSLGGSIIHSRATHADIVELVVPADNVRTFRISTNTMGAGYVESISNTTLLNIRDGQPNSMRGVALMRPVLEADNAARIGRFGWKTQHASLESFSADAYLNEMGITSPLFPDENTSSGTYVGFGTKYDPVADPEDDGVDVVVFADFMRSTKAPGRSEITAEVLSGETVFNSVGCNTCHVTSIVTAPEGTVINGGAFVVPNALGNKLIHPYSDFLLHDIGTGDGIPVQSTPEYAYTAKLIRTAPLWGLRTRSRLMHDGLSFTLEDAINRHKAQARGTTRNYRGLSAEERKHLNAFLNSL